MKVARMQGQTAKCALNLGGILHPLSSIARRGFRRLGLEGAAAAAALHSVRVVELEPAGFETFIEVDGRAIEVEGAFLVDHYGDAVVLVLRIDLLVELLVEAESVGESAAATASDADAKHHGGLDFLVGNDPLDLAGSLFGEDDTHGNSPQCDRFFNVFDLINTCRSPNYSHRPRGGQRRRFFAAGTLPCALAVQKLAALGTSATA